MGIGMLIRLKRHFVLLVLLCSIAVFFGMWVIIHSKNGSWILTPNEVEKTLSNSTKSKLTLPIIPRQKNRPINFWDAVNVSVVIAKSIMKRKRPVLVTLINNAYLPFVYSWLCNTVYMNIHEQVLFITTDERSKLKLNRDWPQVNVVCLPEETSLNDNQAYSKVGYVKLMVKRTEIINSLLENNIEMLLFEVDCLWISNPINDCKRRAINHDVIVTCINQKRTSIAGGFIYMIPTAATKRLWGKLNERMRGLGKEIKNKDSKRTVPESKNDQIFFMQLIQNRFGGVKYDVLPWDYYPDGKWYKMKKSKRDQKKPVIINNNWVIGNGKKVTRAKKWGHWFINGHMKCLMNNVDKVVKKGLYDL